MKSSNDVYQKDLKPVHAIQKLTINILVLILTFYGWMLLGCVTLGIGLLWLYPYMTLTFRNAYKAMKEDALKQGRVTEADFENIIKIEDTTAKITDRKSVV